MSCFYYEPFCVNVIDVKPGEIHVYERELVPDWSIDWLISVSMVSERGKWLFAKLIDHNNSPDVFLTP